MLYYLTKFKVLLGYILFLKSTLNSLFHWDQGNPDFFFGSNVSQLYNKVLNNTF